MSEKEKILETLQPLLKKAKKESLFFYCNYRDLWFGPSKIESLWNDGRFVWGPVNWELRDPNAKLHELEMQMLRLESEIADWKLTIKGETNHD